MSEIVRSLDVPGLWAMTKSCSLRVSAILAMRSVSNSLVGFVKDWSAELSVMHMQVVPYIKCLHLLTAQHSAMPSFALIPRFLSDFDKGELPYAMGLRLPSSSNWHSTQAIANLEASVMMM